MGFIKVHIKGPLKPKGPCAINAANEEHITKPHHGSNSEDRCYD